MSKGTHQHFVGDTWEGLYQPCGQQDFSPQGLPPRILLGDDKERFSRACREIWKVPEVFQNNTPTARRFIIHLCTMVFCSVGYRYTGPFSYRHLSEEICHRRDWVLHKVAWGRVVTTITQKSVEYSHGKTSCVVLASLIPSSMTMAPQLKRKQATRFLENWCITTAPSSFAHPRLMA